MGNTTDESEDNEMDWEIQRKRTKKRIRKSRGNAESEESSSTSLNEQERESIYKVIGVDKPIHKKTKIDISKTRHTKTTDTKPSRKNSTNNSRPGPSSTIPISNPYTLLNTNLNEETFTQKERQVRPKNI